MRIKKINEIICLGNKITKGYGNEINNSSSKYDMNAKIVFEPWKEYEISQTNFEKLSKVFWFESNFLKMNRKIGFELSCSQKIKMENDLKLSFENYLNNRNNSKQRDKFSVIEMLLQNNSIARSSPAMVRDDVEMLIRVSTWKQGLFALQRHQCLSYFLRYF